jgi:hypothetical protein
MSAPAEAILGDEDDIIRAPRKKRGRPEAAIVNSIRQWLQLAVPGAVCWASQNEVPFRTSDPRAGFAMMAARRAAGMVKGAPDLTVACPNGVTIYLEVKAPRGVIQPAQVEFHERLRRIGHRVAVVRSIDDARAVFKAAGVIR